jgi:hypothetical protein
VGPTVTGGLVFWPWNAAGDVLRLFRELTVSAPDELMLVANVLGAPDGSGTKAAAIGACHCGALRDGEAAVRPIKAFGTPVMDTVGPMTYCEINAMLDAGYPKGARNYWKSQFLPELTDEAIHTMVECYEKCPSPMSEIYREHLHGAAARVGVGETAFPLRSPGYNFLVLSQWMDPADECGDAAVRWRGPLCQLPGRRRARRCGGSRVWSQLPSTPRVQDQVRSGELLPQEPEHPSVVVTPGIAPSPLRDRGGWLPNHRLEVTAARDGLGRT